MKHFEPVGFAATSSASFPNKLKVVFSPKPMRKPKLKVKHSVITTTFGVRALFAIIMSYFAVGFASSYLNIFALPVLVFIAFSRFPLVNGTGT